MSRLLVRSPLPGIALLMDRVVECSALVPDLVEALVAGDNARIHDLAKEISMLEGKADHAKNAVREQMPIRLFLPLDRRDVLKLISQIDAVADCAEDVGVLLTLRPLQVPEAMQGLLREFVERVMQTVQTAATLVRLLDPLLQSGFGQRISTQARGVIDKLHRREHEADKLQDQLAKALFQQEETLSPVAIFMWTKVLNKIGDMANHAENVGDQFRLFIAR
ncbi:MAG: TIGR00153 family protein [Polyangiales bacterium]